MSELTLPYALIRDLCLFQSQYEQLTEAIDQAELQLNNSPSLTGHSPQALQRSEWRAWLAGQILAKKRQRENLIKTLADRGIAITELP